MPASTCPSQLPEPARGRPWWYGWYVVLAACAYAAACLYLHEHQIFHSARAYPSDMPAHIGHAGQMERTGRLNAHPGFHLLAMGAARAWRASGLHRAAAGALYPAGMAERQASLRMGGLVVLVAVQFATFLLLCHVLRVHLPRSAPPVLVAPAAAALLVCTAACLPAFNQNAYLGQGSPNVFHNSTAIAMRPFAILALHNALLHLRTGAMARLWAASAFLFLSASCKPSFAVVFLPAWFLLLLLRRTTGLRHWGGLAALSLPTAALVVVQSRLLYAPPEPGAPAKAASILVAPAQVLAAFTPDVGVSMLLLLAFPLWVLLAGLASGRRLGASLRLCWIMMALAMVQAFLFAEGGDRFYHGNFTWSLVIAAFLLFVFSLAHLGRWLRADLAVPAPGRRRAVRLLALHLPAWGLLGWHVASGVVYVLGLMRGGSYC